MRHPITVVLLATVLVLGGADAGTLWAANQTSARADSVAIGPERAGSAGEAMNATVLQQTQWVWMPITRAPALATVPMVIDHNSVAQFSRIPDRYVTAARSLRMIFIDRSVGGNIDSGLTCLSYASIASAPSHCKRPDATTAGLVANSRYNRSNWRYQFDGSGCDYWYDKIRCFISVANPIASQYDVFAPQLSYLEVASGSTIAASTGGFFNNPNGYDVHDLEAWATQHPGKVLVYATTSLARSIGTTESQQFNDQLRQYARNNGRVLFDIADIEAHAPDGRPCYDNRDGVQYCGPNGCENYENDRLSIPGVCPAYTSEVDGGHLGNMATGKIRIAKAFWVLMARLAGWDEVSP